MIRLLWQTTDMSKTPNREKSIQNVQSPERGQFDRITCSPGIRSPGSPHGNLTGSARKVKDAAADWHNTAQKWSSTVAAGSGIVTQIANLKLEAVEGRTDDEGIAKTTEMPPKLGPLCEELLSHLEKLEKLVTKMETMTKMLRGVEKLERHQKSADSLDPMFLTWPAHKFHKASRDLHEMYEKELKLKRTIVENIAHTKDRDLIMFYTASWIHEPFLDEKFRDLLEAMVIETGHKPC